MSPSYKRGWGGGISRYIHDSLNFKSRGMQTLTQKNVESLSIGDFKSFNIFLKDIYSVCLKSNKLFYATRDFNLNVLDFSTNEKFTKFLNLTFEYALVLIIKPTRVTKNTSTVWVLNKRGAPNKAMRSGGRGRNKRGDFEKMK